MAAAPPVRAEIVQIIGASLRASNPDGPQSVIVQATFLGDSASLYTSELYLDAPTFLGPIFNNHLTPVNATASLGSFLPETVLHIRNQSFFLPNPNDPGSPASYNFAFFPGNGTLPPNPDRLPHAVFEFDADDPHSNVKVSFEDLIGGGDHDFNDAVYSFTNVRAALVDIAVSPLFVNVGEVAPVNAGDSRSFAAFRDSFGNAGTVTNSGSVFNYGDGENSGLLENHGSFFNDIPGTLRNAGGARIENPGEFGSFGSLTNEGQIVNSGTVNNGGFLESFGSIVNEHSGTLRNLFPGLFENRGTTENRGTVENSGTVENYLNLFNEAGAIVRNLGGTIRNIASLFNRANGTIENGNGGNLINEGQLVNSGTTDNEGWLRNFGNIVNEHSGTLRNLFPGLFENRGTTENRGTVENSGTVENYLNLFNEAGAIVRNLGGTIRNIAGTWINAAGSSVENGGSIDNSGTFRVDAQASVTGSGSYSQSGGSTVVDGILGAPLIDIEGGLLSGAGTLIGNVRIGGGGKLLPGNSPGTLTIDGDLILDGGGIEIEFEALTLHDLLEISGEAIFDGGWIDYLFAFTPNPGDRFVFLTAGGGIRGLDTLTFNFHGDLRGLRFVTAIDGNSLVLLAAGGNGGTSVPLPGVLWLLAPGLLILALGVRPRFNPRGCPPPAPAGSRPGAPGSRVSRPSPA